jgi:hypothetical protein
LFMNERCIKDEWCLCPSISLCRAVKFNWFWFDLIRNPEIAEIVWFNFDSISIQYWIHINLTPKPKYCFNIDSILIQYWFNIFSILI